VIGIMKDIFSLRLFTRVARLGSFSAAARECGLSQSQVSRIVADLEASLGARLLARTTRAVTPTEAGAGFLLRMEPISPRWMKPRKVCARAAICAAWCG
jgi:DNA-binding transcriptional LysR family regulator